MKFSTVLDFYLNIPKTSFPYKVPSYIIPEIFQWCGDNNAVDSLNVSTVKQENKSLEFIITFEKLIFTLNPKTKELTQKFEEFMYANRYIFWKKSFRFRNFWSWRKEDGRLHIMSYDDLQNLVQKVFQKILRINNLIGPENWCIGEYNSVSQFAYGGAYSYMNYIYFFDKKDRNLYKLTDI